MSNLPPSNGASAPHLSSSLMEEDWKLRMMINRKASQSTVIIVETSDIKRIQEIINIDYAKIFGEKTMRVIQYDLQTNQVLENGFPLSIDVSPLQDLLKALTTSTTTAIIYYVFLKQHAEFLNDFLMYSAQNEKLYANHSTVIVITSDSSLFPEIVQRFSVVIENVMPTENERRTLITSLISEFSQKIPMNVNNVDEIIQASRGLTLHDIESITLKSIYEVQTVDLRYFTNYKIELLRKMGLSYIIPQYGFESIGGYDYLKDYIQSNIISILKNPSDARELGLSIPKGIILFGPPGTGKTLFAKALAKEIGLPMVALNPSDFFRSLVGETEYRVKMITRVIESLAPIIVFIDEIDQLAMSREKMMITDSGVSRRFTNMILEWLGDTNRKSFIVGATNYISDVDPAFIRPGRIDEIIVVLPPDYEARKQILQVHTSVIRKIPYENVDFSELAKMTLLWTGAELEKLTLSAARNAFRRKSKKVTMQDFTDAFNSIEINIQERERTVQRVITEAKKLENINKEFLNKALKVFASDASMNERVKSLLAQLK
jgi:AAA+ superfamily predicted ATPase